MSGLHMALCCSDRPARRTRPPDPEMHGPRTGRILHRGARSHMRLPEFSAFLSGKTLPWMRRWELPFAIFQSRLSDTMAVLDCSINPSELGQWIGELYPHVLYRHANPLVNGEYLLPPAAPDESFDRLFCLTLSNILPSRSAKN